MDGFQLILALCMGISLSAACGFRVFVPLLALALGVRFLGISVNDNLAWLGADTALVCLSVATVVELLAYYIPFVDNMLDAVVSPLALAAGAVITAGLLPEMPEFVQWGVGILAGAGAAGTVQLGTTAARGASSAGTAGLGNFVVATAENAASVFGSVMAVVVSPILALVILVALVWLVWRLLLRLRRRSASAASVG